MIDITRNILIVDNTLKYHRKTIITSPCTFYRINLGDYLCTIDSFGGNDFGKYAGNSWYS